MSRLIPRPIAAFARWYAAVFLLFFFLCALLTSLAGALSVLDTASSRGPRPDDKSEAGARG